MKNLTIAILITVIILQCAPFVGVSAAGRIGWAVVNTIVIAGFITTIDRMKLIKSR
ncbi:MAG: hypothetical protein Q4F11_07685 [Eubacteriales bacterium]|nr:hypothetical protein [Eubacteriales bacterium]